MTNDSVKGAFLILRVPKSFKAKVEQMAQEQEVSISELVRRILEETVN